MTAHANWTVSPPRTEDGKVRGLCECGWVTGWRRNREGALVGLAGHRAKTEALSLARAEQIRYDHAHGLHDDFAHPAGCVYGGCEDAARLLESISK